MANVNRESAPLTDEMIYTQNASGIHREGSAHDKAFKASAKAFKASAFVMRDIKCPRCRERYPHASDYEVGRVARPAMGHQMYFMAEGRIALCAAIATATQEDANR